MRLTVGLAPPTVSISSLGSHPTCVDFRNIQASFVPLAWWEVTDRDSASEKRLCDQQIYQRLKVWVCVLSRAPQRRLQRAFSWSPISAAMRWWADTCSVLILRTCVWRDISHNQLPSEPLWRCPEPNEAQTANLEKKSACVHQAHAAEHLLHKTRLKLL